MYNKSSRIYFLQGFSTPSNNINLPQNKIIITIDIGNRHVGVLLLVLPDAGGGHGGDEDDDCMMASCICIYME